MAAGKAASRSILQFLWPFLSLALLLGVIVAIGADVGSIEVSRTVTEALIMLVVVVGLYIFIGNSGVLAFGHMSFMAVGAYATAWQTCCAALKAFTMNGLPDILLHNTVPNLPAAALAVVFTAVVALVFGAIIMRLSGVAASIATLAMLFIVYVTYSNWENLTRGKGSLVGLPTYVTPWIAYGCAVGALLVAFLYQESRFGLALRASREDIVAARAAGVNIYLQRLIAFVLSGLVVGLGGVLHGHFLGTIAVDSYFLSMTLMTLAMLVVGGMRSMAGAVVGVLALSIVIEAFRQLENGIDVGGVNLALPAGVQELALALAILLILIFRPRGIMAGREISWPFGRRPMPVAEEGAGPLQVARG